MVRQAGSEAAEAGTAAAVAGVVRAESPERTEEGNHGWRERTRLPILLYRVLVKNVEQNMV
jgi:hypothetical protein